MQTHKRPQVIPVYDNSPTVHIFGEPIDFITVPNPDSGIMGLLVYIEGQDPARVQLAIVGMTVESDAEYIGAVVNRWGTPWTAWKLKNRETKS